jgi:SCY1-like protein 1
VPSIFQNVASPGGQTTLVNSAAGAAGALAGWALSSIGKKLAPADLQSTMSAVAQVASDDIGRPTSAPPSSSGLNGSASRAPSYVNITLAASVPGIAPGTSALGSTSKVKGMQLGASKLPVTHMPAEWAEEAAAEAEAEEATQGNPWGNDDLMDVNADQDDWSKFLSFILRYSANVLFRCIRNRAFISSCDSRTWVPSPSAGPPDNHI